MCLTVTCSCCPYLYFGSAIMLVTYFVNFRKLNDHLFGKELFIRFTASAFRKLLSVYVFSYFPFGFEGRMWDLIVSVPDHRWTHMPFCWFYHEAAQIPTCSLSLYLPGISRYRPRYRYQYDPHPLQLHCMWLWGHYIVVLGWTFVLILAPPWLPIGRRILLVF